MKNYLISFLVSWKVVAMVCGSCPDSCHSTGKYGDGPTECYADACCNNEVRTAERTFDTLEEAQQFIKDAPPNASDFKITERKDVPLTP